MNFHENWSTGSEVEIGETAGVVKTKAFFAPFEKGK
jgi:hypothetical protein